MRRPAAVARAIKPAWHAPAAPFPQKPRTPALADRALPTEMVTLRLGDFLDHLPSELLETGSPDRSIPMPFELSSLSERIGRGDAMIRLTEVYRRMPDIFRSDAAINPDRTIPFPWKKVLAMIREAKAGAADGGISPTGVEALAQKFKARKQRQPVKTAPKPYAASEAAPDSAPEGAMSVAPATTTGLRLVAPPAVAPNSGTAGPAAPAAHAHELAQLRTERDAALARAAEFGAEYDAAIARTGELTAERDTAVARVAELTAGHDAAVARLAELAAERDAATVRFEKLAADSQTAVAQTDELTARHDAHAAREKELTAERDAATARVAEHAAEREAAAARSEKLAANSEAAITQTAELTARLDAALARTNELTAEHDAALARAAEPAAENDTAQARVTALTTERDAALARAEKLVADSEAALALGTELTAERDRVTAVLADLAADDDRASVQLAGLATERDTALSRIAELTAERDAAAARCADLLQKAAAPAPAAASEVSLVIEGYKNTIDALIRERDALRKNAGHSGANPAPKNDPTPARATTTHEPLRDAYAELFPARKWFRRAAAAAALAVLAGAILSQLPLGALSSSGADASAQTSPVAAPEIPSSVLSEVAQPEPELTLESNPPKETKPLPLTIGGQPD